jgi:hypothetical protein
MVYVIAIIVFAVAIAGMAVGTIIAGRRLKGSCGGLAGLHDEHGNPFCEACSNPAADCEEFRQRVHNK